MARLLALTTATPPHRVKQSEAKAITRELYSRQCPDIDRHMPVFDNAAIDSRALADGLAIPVVQAYPKST